MRWTWDPEKDRVNRRKHRINFEIAQLVFQDPALFTDSDSYPFEQRWRTTGAIGGMLITVIYTLPDVGRNPGRIISARKATLRERIIYEEGYGQTY